ncbi:MAG TPA: hypothetical protein VGB74_14190 [Actinoplanes sp.]
MTAHGSGPRAGTPRPAHPGPARHAAEQLLRRDPAARGLSPQLAALLDAAAAPARPGELVGRSAAVAAFRDGRLHAAAIPVHRRRSARSRLARMLALKTAIGLAMATGGVALAAATGTLPGTPRLAEPSPGTHAPSVTSSPADDKTDTPLIAPADTAPAASPTSCPTADGNTGATGKPPAGGPTARPAPPPPAQQQLKMASCVPASPSVAPAGSPSPSGSFPPPGGQQPPGGAAPTGGAGDCRDQCPPPADRDDQGRPPGPPPAMPAG